VSWGAAGKPDFERNAPNNGQTVPLGTARTGVYGYMPARAHVWAESNGLAVTGLCLCVAVTVLNSLVNELFLNRSLRANSSAVTAVVARLYAL
jgi:hypothetical protein